MKDPALDAWIREFEKRFVEFERARQEEMLHLKHDFLSRMFSEYIVFGDKPTYDGRLQGILSEKELGLLETDPQFTRAWRIFVDLCWLRKQLTRAAMVVAAIVVVMLLALFCWWALPHVAGPKEAPRPDY
jgi:hypothetical protein